ncbi:MAG: hypothetical protein FJX74_04885, partial [Armatimonadetes bacterium]|nr:hypothetical protein [Armatimonadota bacterium]
PVPMAAIKFGPEFWQALEADAGEGAQDNLFRKLFSGGLLFGIGPLNNVLAKARGAEEAVRWAAPPTLKASLVLRLDEPNVQVTVEGQVVPLKAEAPGADPNSLLNQLQFIFFPLRVNGGQALLADMARSMTLVVTGLAPDTIQRFTWESGPPSQSAPYQQNQAPLVVQQQAPRHREQIRDQFDEGLALRMGGPQPPAIGFGAAGAAGPALGGGLGGGAARAESPPVAAPAPLEVPSEVEATPMAGEAASLYPVSRAASLVGARGHPEAAVGGLDQRSNQAFATIDHVARTDGSVTLDYYTNSVGLQEVEVVDADGRPVQKIAAGPAPTNGRALASWRPKTAKEAVGGAEAAVTVRNWVLTPLGAQISETTAPLPTANRAGEPLSAIAPQPPAVVDVSVEELSVAGDLLQVRAYVAPVRGPDGFLAPPVDISITDEAGDVVKRLAPTPPAPGKDYIFAWDATDEAGETVADGRYVLRIAASADSAQGSARSELRYWVDVPVEETLRRLEALHPAVVQTLQAELAEQKPGLVLVAYLAPQVGRLRAVVVDALGHVVRHLVDDDVVPGAQKLIWDGTDDDRQPLPDAAYAVNLELDAGDAGAWWGIVAVDGLEASDGN